MVLSVPPGEIALLVAAVMAAGVATGILAGLFGIGGGAIIVPVLYEIFRILGVPEEVRMQLCVGSSMAIIVPTTIRSYIAHRAKGLVFDDVMRRWAVPAVAGVAAGSVIAYFAPSAVFKVVFTVVVTVIAIKLLLGRDNWRIADDFPGQPAMIGYGFLIGITSSLMGVSGGSVSNMIQTLHGKPLHNAVATSAGLGVPITIAGTIGLMIAGWPQMALLPPFSVGYVSLLGVAIMAPVSSFTAPYGARLAHRLSKRQLEIGFGLLLLLVSARFVASLV
ncbi:MAG: sulfite exporter TauE/SafE family protein [Xanthobacteraceae bacterium]|nr:sulfite exporter TauE/SafE family protein [Xanthobacteraceae bacterium]